MQQFMGGDCLEISLETTVQLNIKEEKIIIPQTIKHVLHVVGEHAGEHTEYHANVWDIAFSGFDIIGRFSLTKYQHERHNVIIRKRFFEKPTIVEEDGKRYVWWFNADKRYCPIKDGRPATANNSQEYRFTLKVQAANHNLLIPSIVIDKAFRPIDQKLMELYLTIKHHYDKKR